MWKIVALLIASIIPLNSEESTMRTHKAGIELIKSFEGLMLEAYLCPANIWTIGYGHTKGVQKGDTLEDETEAEALLAKDLLIYERIVNKALEVPVTRNQFDALVSFVYNIGGGAFRKSTLLRKLNSGDTKGASVEFRRWVRAGGKKLRGLVKRREAEEALFNRREDL